MKRIQRVTAAAEDVQSEKLDTALDGLKDDFDYIIAGIEKLGRDGAESANNALIIAERLSDELQKVVSQISSAM